MREQQEVPKKLTFYDLRFHYGGNIAQLAHASGVDGRSVHAMLFNRGVTRSDAQCILAAFNHLNHTDYLLDDLEVYLVEECQEQHLPADEARPTFRQVCERCAVAWMDLSRGAGVPDEVGLALYNGEPVFLEDCEDILAVLSEVSAESWTRREVAGIRLRTDSWNNPRLVSVAVRSEGK